MATFPGGIYSATNPTATSPRNSPSLAGEVTGLNGEVIAIEMALGVNLGNVAPASVSSMLPSITGAGRAATPGSLTQTGGFTVTDSIGAGIQFTTASAQFGVSSSVAAITAGKMSASVGASGSSTVAVGPVNFTASSFSASVTGGGPVALSPGISTVPVSSHTATLAFGAASVGTPMQNTLGYDIIVTVSIPVTVASGGSIECGVGPTSSPTTDEITPALSAAAVVTFSQYVPSGYYLSVATTGTITVGTPVTQVTPV